MMQAACRFIPITSPSSRNGFSATGQILHDVVTVIDNALTRPWVVDKKYRHNPRYRWTETSCIETNSMVAIGRESYFMSADGMLMPVRKNQPPPDLRYFKEWTK